MGRRLAPLDGIVAAALWVAGFIVLQGPADQPDSDSSPARALQYFTKEDGAILAGTLLFMLGTLFFLWFLGAIRTQLYTAEGGTNRLTTIAFAAGVATAISLLLMGGTQAAGAINNDHLSGEAARVYLGIGDAFFYAAELAAAVTLTATGLLSLGKLAFPKWLGWISLLIALWLLIPPVGWAALIFAFPLWLLVVSALLFSRGRTAASA